MKKHIGLVAFVAMIFAGCGHDTLTDQGVVVQQEQETVAENIDVNDEEVVEESIAKSGKKLELRDVENSGGSGTSWVAIIDGTTAHRVEAINLPELTNGDFYEGWLVKAPVPGGFVSTGAMVYDEANDMFVLEYGSDSDLSAYKTVVITREPDDGDPAPAAHVIEAKYE